jgi:sugar lactone lactonase YvrE
MRLAERFTTPIAYHGEGPFWDWRTNRLMCVDVLAGAVAAIACGGQVHRYPLPSRAVTVIRRRARGGFVVATEHGLLLADDDLAEFEHLAELVTDPAVRTNDGGCDPLGGFVIGTMAYDERSNGGAVYRVGPDRRVTEVLAPVSISNGVQWSTDGSQVFYIDTPTRCVAAFDVDPTTGAWASRRTHIRIDDVQGSPDGMAIDEDDGLWIALWGGGAIVHYDRSGRLVETIAVPGVSQVSSCAFGGEGRGVLFITTSRKDLAVSREPNAGAVFAIQTATHGPLQPEFGG